MIPESVTRIGSNAFAGCTELQVLVLSENVKKIGVCAFVDCRNLIEIEWDAIDAEIIADPNVKSLFANAGVDGNGIRVTFGKSVRVVPSRLFDSSGGRPSPSPEETDEKNSIKIVEVIYEGTIEEWAAVEKGNDWNANCDFTKVQCSDGTVTV